MRPRRIDRNWPRSETRFHPDIPRSTFRNSEVSPMTRRYGIDTSVLVRLLTGSPASEYERYERQLIALVEHDGAEVFASNQVLGSICGRSAPLRVQWRRSIGSTEHPDQRSDHTAEFGHRRPGSIRRPRPSTASSTITFAKVLTPTNRWLPCRVRREKAALAIKLAWNNSVSLSYDPRRRAEPGLTTLHSPLSTPHSAAALAATKAMPILVVPGESGTSMVARVGGFSGKYFR